MQTEDAGQLAEKIAQILLSKPQPTDFSSLKMSIEALKKRLDKLEADLVARPAFAFPHLPHPSQDRFNIPEAIADELFARLTDEKACTFEPNDKPCDHCAMCSSRGF